MTLIIKSPQDLSVEKANLVKKTIDYRRASLSPNTWRTYRSMWIKFTNWCQQQNTSPLPTSSETIALYLSDIADAVSFSTLDATIAAIEKIHKEKEVSITGNQKLYRDVRRGIRRSHKEKLQIKQSPALSIVDLKARLKKLTNSARDIRDRALITIGYWGAFRRSELSSIQYDHISMTEEGVIVNLLGSKTSDELEEVFISNTIDAEICPVLALKHWLTVSGISEGPVFRSLIKGGGVSGKQLSAHSVSHIMKRLFGRDYSGHSLRRGLITEAAKSGTPIHEIQKFSRHRSADMILKYSESARGFESTPAKVLGV